jgi:hypothetical protein
MTKALTKPMLRNTREGFKVTMSMPEKLHPDSQALVVGFAEALAKKLTAAQEKYGYTNLWQADNWTEECLMHFNEHVSKGDPIDVAAYCAFMWFHEWKTNSDSKTANEK